MLQTASCHCWKRGRAVASALASDSVLFDGCNHAWYASCSWGRKGTCGNISASLQLTPVKTRV